MEELITKQLCRRCRYQRIRERTALLMDRITTLLDIMDPDPFLRFDHPDGYGYRRIPLNTFYHDNVFPADEDEPGITIPWPAGEAHVVTRIFHLAGVEQLPPRKILRVLAREAWDPRVAAWSVAMIEEILSDTTYHHIGLAEPDPYQEHASKWTLIADSPSEPATSNQQMSKPSYTCTCALKEGRV